MKWTLMPPRQLKNHLSKVMGKKSKVVFYIIEQMVDKPGWTTLNMKIMQKKTKSKPKKIYKILKMLKKRNIIQYRKKALQIKPTKKFAMQANTGYRQYMQKHPRVKAKVLKAQHKISKKRHKKHHFLQKLHKRF